MIGKQRKGVILPNGLKSSSRGRASGRAIDFLLCANEVDFLHEIVCWGRQSKLILEIEPFLQLCVLSVLLTCPQEFDDSESHFSGSFDE